MQFSDFRLRPRLSWDRFNIIEIARLLATSQNVPLTTLATANDLIVRGDADIAVSHPSDSQPFLLTTGILTLLTHLIGHGDMILPVEKKDRGIRWLGVGFPLAID